jgi:hypothetical protein
VIFDVVSRLLAHHWAIPGSADPKRLSRGEVRLMVGKREDALDAGGAVEGVLQSAEMRSLVVRVVGLVGCLAVAAIHVIDQGGVPGSKGPEYVQILYYGLEAAGVVAAALLLANQARLGWFLSMGVAAGPILGYVLSRGPGLPDYTEDIGNWAEPLGVISLVVEGVLLLLAAVSLTTFPRRARYAAQRSEIS